MSIIIRLNNADFSGRGFPSIDPFVAIADAAFAYDFRNRAGRLIDVAGRCVLNPWRNDHVGTGTSSAPVPVHQHDPSVVETSADSLGIVVKLGYLRLGKAREDIPVDGSRKFTLMVTGGWSGIAVPPDRLIGQPEVCSLLDLGTDITGDGGVAMEESALGSSNGGIGVRIKSGGNRLQFAKASPTQKTCRFLTYDGATWTMTDKTLDQSASITNAAMGHIAAIPALTNYTSEMTAGDYYGGGLSYAGHIPTLYQLAMWDRVLTAPEMADQYARTRFNFAAASV